MFDEDDGHVPVRLAYTEDQVAGCLDVHPDGRVQRCVLSIYRAGEAIPWVLIVGIVTEDGVLR